MKEDFIPPIDDFIATLKAYKGIEIRTSSMSTKMFGEYDLVMHILKKSCTGHFARKPM